MSSLSDFMVWQSAYSLAARLVLAPSGILAEFHGVDQQVGHEAMHTRANLSFVKAVL